MAPIHISAREGRVELVEKQLVRGFDINAKDEKSGDTCLHRACAGSHTELVQFLLDKGANVAIKNKELRVALHEAGDAGALEAAGMLLQRGADPAAVDNSRATPLHKAALRGHAALAHALLQALRDREARHREMVAAEEHSTFSDRVQELVERKDIAGYAPLHLAAQQGHTATMQVLLEAGAGVEPTNSFNATPLHEAVRAGHPDAAHLLLAHGADAHAKDKRGREPGDYMAGHSAQLKDALTAALAGQPHHAAEQNHQQQPVQEAPAGDADTSAQSDERGACGGRGGAAEGGGGGESAEDRPVVSRAEFLRNLHLSDDEDDC